MCVGPSPPRGGRNSLLAGDDDDSLIFNDPNAGAPDLSGPGFASSGFPGPGFGTERLGSGSLGAGPPGGGRGVGSSLGRGLSGSGSSSSIGDDEMFEAAPRLPEGPTAAQIERDRAAFQRSAAQGPKTQGPKTQGPGTQGPGTRGFGGSDEAARRRAARRTFPPPLPPHETLLGMRSSRGSGSGAAAGERPRTPGFPIPPPAPVNRPSSPVNRPPAPSAMSPEALRRHKIELAQAMRRADDAGDAARMAELDREFFDLPEGDHRIEVFDAYFNRQSKAAEDFGMFEARAPQTPKPTPTPTPEQRSGAAGDRVPEDRVAEAPQAREPSPASPTGLEVRTSEAEGPVKPAASSDGPRLTLPTLGKEARDRARRRLGTLGAPGGGPVSEREARDMLNVLAHDEKLFDRHRDKLSQLYAAIPPDPAFRRVDARRLASLKTTIEADSRLKATFANWRNLRDPADRKNAVNALFGKVFKAYGMADNPPKVAFKALGGDKENVGAFYDSGTDTITINTKGPTFEGSSEALAAQRNITIVDVTVEEAVHAFQSRLIERAQSGAIKPGDPEFRQAQLFLLNKVRHLKIDGRDLGHLREYAEQPLERHAKEVAGTVSEFFAQRN